jgi:hypothetical protein
MKTPKPKTPKPLTQDQIQTLIDRLINTGFQLCAHDPRLAFAAAQALISHMAADPKAYALMTRILSHCDSRGPFGPGRRRDNALLSYIRACRHFDQINLNKHLP